MRVRLAAKCHIHCRPSQETAAGEEKKKEFAIWDPKKENYISDWLSKFGVIQAFIEEAKKAVVPEATETAKKMVKRAERVNCSATASQSKCKDIFWLEIIE